MKLKATYETEVFVSQGGYLVIRQEDNMGEESAVILSPEQARLVAREIGRLTEDESWWQVAAYEDSGA